MMTTEQIFDTLKQHIQDHRPLSLVRVGDGEAMTLNGLCDVTEIGRVIQRQLGNGIPFDDVWKIRNILIGAINGCDILGLPLEDKSKGDPESYWARAVSIVNENCTPPEQQCSIDIHYDLSREQFIELMEASRRVFYIGCRNLEREIRHVSGQDVQAYHIAPERMFTTYNGKPHWPNQFDRIGDWMDEQDFTGSICFVGAGVLGKIYCNMIRDRGGVAMDIGSLMDRWAGFVTRGPNRGRDVTTRENILAADL